eukprot:2140732-Prymnesium_polylepis.1
MHATPRAYLAPEEHVGEHPVLARWSCGQTHTSKCKVGTQRSQAHPTRSGWPQGVRESVEKQ